MDGSAGRIDHTWSDEPGALDRIYGGTGGVRFDDAIAGGDAVAALWMASGRLVDSLQLRYRNGRRTARHGGTGGVGGWIDFAPGERIVSVSGQHLRYVHHLVIGTNLRDLRSGTPAADAASFRFEAPKGMQVIGFRGRCRTYVDALGVCVAPVPRPPRRPEVLARATLRRMMR